jgi:hypothetical protein
MRAKLDHLAKRALHRAIVFEKLGRQGGNSFTGSGELLDVRTVRNFSSPPGREGLVAAPTAAAARTVLDQARSSD